MSVFYFLGHLFLFIALNYDLFEFTLSGRQLIRVLSCCNIMAMIIYHTPHDRQPLGNKGAWVATANQKAQCRSSPPPLLPHSVDRWWWPMWPWSSWYKIREHYMIIMMIYQIHIVISHVQGKILGNQFLVASSRRAAEYCFTSFLYYLVSN